MSKERSKIERSPDPSGWRSLGLGGFLVVFIVVMVIRTHYLTIIDVAAFGAAIYLIYKGIQRRRLLARRARDEAAIMNYKGADDGRRD